MVDLCLQNNNLMLKNILIKNIKRNEHIPKRIEAFDNSNIQGKHAVAGVVCFVNAKPFKKDYRHYNIKSVQGIDDFESMREVVFRRYNRQIKEKNQLPDLILIDGGKGQLSAAKSSLDKLGLGYIKVIGLAKRLEQVFIPESNSPQNIAKTSPGIYLLRKIRDEVHRYSIAFHRKKRSNKLFDSILSNVKGIGKKRIKLLWSNYDSLKDILKASNQDINKKTGIPIKYIHSLKKVLKNEKESK